MSGEPDIKKARSMAKIGTHNGAFHCDDALACFMLKQLPEYQDAEVIRSRDSAVLDSCDVVVDVGGVYDHEKRRYDHHQRSFSESMNSLNPDKKWVTKLSSAGLVYFHYGCRIISQALSKPEDDKLTQIIFDKLYEGFLEEVDGIDNGIDPTDEKPRYFISTNLSSRVSFLNPRWNEPSDEAEYLRRFHKAVDLVGTEFMERLDFNVNSWWPARKLVQDAVNKRFEVDASGEIISFGEGGCPWKEHLLTLEKEQNLEPTIKFVLYTDPMGKWRVQCVPAALGSFENRISLKQEWRGIRDEELSKLSGIPGCVFVHAGGFIGGNLTYEGALEMARRTLQG